MKKEQGGAESVLQSMGAKFLIVLLNAVSGVITARALHPQGRGELAAILLWPLVLSGALTFGLPSALTYRMRSNRRRAALYVSVTLILGTLIGILATIVAIAITPFLLHNYNSDVIHVARWLMPNLIIAVLLLIGRASLEADIDFMRSGAVLVVPPLLTVAGLLGLLAVHRLTAGSAAIVYVVAGFPAFYFLLSSVPLALSFKLRQFTVACKMLMTYGLRSYGIDLCGTIAFYVDQALVVGLLDPSAMGSYVVSLSFSRITSIPHQALASVLFPKMVGHSAESTSRLTRQGLRVGGTLALISLIVILPLGHAILSSFYGHAYGQDTSILQMLTLEAALSGCILIAAQAFMASGRPGVVTIQQMIGLACSLPFLLILIPRMGLRGAALSILLSTFLRFCFITVSFVRAFGGGIPSLLINGADLALVVARFNKRSRQDDAEIDKVLEETIL